MIHSSLTWTELSWFWSCFFRAHSRSRTCRFWPVSRTCWLKTIRLYCCRRHASPPSWRKPTRNPLLPANRVLWPTAGTNQILLTLYMSQSHFWILFVPYTTPCVSTEIRFSPVIMISFLMKPVDYILIYTYTYIYWWAYLWDGQVCSVNQIINQCKAVSHNKLNVIWCETFLIKHLCC